MNADRQRQLGEVGGCMLAGSQKKKKTRMMKN